MYAGMSLLSSLFSKFNGAATELSRVNICVEFPERGELFGCKRVVNAVRTFGDVEKLKYNRMLFIEQVA